MSKEIIVERGTKTVYREGSKIIKQFIDALSSIVQVNGVEVIAS